MQVLTGTKRQITIGLWQERIENQIQRANDSMECFRRYHEADDLQRLIEDAQRIIECATHCKQAIEYIKTNDIQ